MGLNEDINQKIANLLSGNATKQDEMDIKSWLNESPKNKYEYLRLKEFWQERTVDVKLINHEDQKWEIWRTLQNNLDQTKSSKSQTIYRKTYWQVAAIILILIAPVVLFILYGNRENDEFELPVSKIIVKSNPAGQKSQFQLPDGSMVWLNAESTLTYNQNFSDSTRLIKLSGEAFFEVKRDTSRPFYVEISDLKVRVLGTEFNVSAYNDDPSITVALIRGSVKVSFENLEKEEVLLSPGYAISYQKEDKSHETFAISKDPFFYQKYVSWKSGILAFDGQNFDEFIKEIKRWYGVKVSIIGTPPKNWQIRASFENEYLNNILDAISFNKEFAFDLSQEKLILMFN